MPLVDALGDWRAEVAERCEVAGVVLDWQTSGECGQPGFSGGGCLALTRVLREAVTNAIRHARPARLAVMIELTDTALACAVRHAYAGVPPEQWEASVGLGSLRERIARHGGTLNWQLEQHELVTPTRGLCCRPTRSPRARMVDIHNRGRRPGPDEETQ
jgi:signal transduction histidine kinase